MTTWASDADIAGADPAGAHLHLVTTRAPAGVGGFADIRPADVLPYRHRGRPGGARADGGGGAQRCRRHARALAEALGGLPLALVVAGALIRSEGYGFAAYQAEIDRL